MSIPITSPRAATTSSLCPMNPDIPRRVSFGATPTPERPPNSRKSTKTISPKTSKLRRTLYNYSASKAPANFTLDQFVPADKIKSMSDLDKEQEARLAKSHKEKALKGVAGVVGWLERKIKGDGIKKV